jgi:phenylpropionate dioxygenase-like ring-hydroxylating dioxygenase large terminal subunit
MSSPHPEQLALVRRLAAGLAGEPAGELGGEVPATHYTSSDRFALERAKVFARQPTIVAHESELPPGACLAVDVAGTSALVVRAPDGGASAFRNACRHRSTELVAHGPPCAKKAIVCPYHGWTYELSGRLVHVPHRASFRGAEESRTSLAPLHAIVAHGFVWVSLAPIDPSSFLAPIASELTALSTEGATLHRRAEALVAGNWKLIIEAFLDGYHIRHLHRDTVYRFFHDARSLAERAGPHIRAVSARRTLTEPPRDDVPLRELATPSYLVFPNTILVFHPDFVSVMTVTPLAPARTRFVHWMIAPEPPRTSEAIARLDKSFALIHDGVFVREDLGIVEAMQRGIETGANEAQLFGDLESAAMWFHESLNDALAK